MQGNIIKFRSVEKEIPGFRQVKLEKNVWYVMAPEGGADYATTAKLFNENGLDFLTPHEAGDLTKLMLWPKSQRSSPERQELAVLFKNKSLWIVGGWICFWPRHGGEVNYDFSLTLDYKKKCDLVVGIKREGPRYLDNEDIKQHLRE